MEASLQTPFLATFKHKADEEGGGSRGCIMAPSDDRGDSDKESVSPPPWNMDGESYYHLLVFIFNALT